MKIQHINFWASDYSNKTGEGKLAQMFVNHLKKRDKLHQIRVAKNNKLLNYKYIIPFVGIFYCWKFFLKKKKYCLYKLPSTMEPSYIHAVTTPNNYWTCHRWRFI